LDVPPECSIFGAKKVGMYLVYLVRGKNGDFYALTDCYSSYSQMKGGKVNVFSSRDHAALKPEAMKAWFEAHSVPSDVKVQDAPTATDFARAYLIHQGIDVTAYEIANRPAQTMTVAPKEPYWTVVFDIKIKKTRDPQLIVKVESRSGAASMA